MAGGEKIVTLEKVCCCWPGWAGAGAGAARVDEMRPVTATSEERKCIVKTIE